MAFMWSMLLMSLVDLFIRSFLLRELDLASVGYYQAAWAVSGLFAGFILNAMGADFYPRLSQVQGDHEEMTRLVNEQTEIGILLALPGLLGTLTFAPWVITVLYSSEFAIAAELLPWLVLGVMGRVVAWPLGFILLAKGAKGYFAGVETLVKIPRVLLVVFCVKQWGLLGAAIAWPLNYVFYMGMAYPLVHRMVGFSYTTECLRLLFIASGAIAFVFVAVCFLPGDLAGVAGGVFTAIVSYASINMLSSRLGVQHRIVRLFRRIPGLIVK